MTAPLPTSQRALVTIDLTQPELIEELRHWVGGTRHPDPQRGPDDDDTLLQDISLADAASYLIRLGAITSQHQTASGSSIPASVGELRESLREAAQRTEATLDAAVSASVERTNDSISALLADIRTVAGPDLTQRLNEMLTTLLSPKGDVLSPLLEQIRILTTKYDQSQVALAEMREDFRSDREAHITEISSATQALMLAAGKAVAPTDAITTGKGFEGQLVGALDHLTGTHGGDFEATGSQSGADGTTTGDGVFHLPNGVSIGVEATISPTRVWSKSVTGVRRARQVSSVLGVVPSREQNKGHMLRWIDPSAAVLVFDPGDDPSLLWAVMSILGERELIKNHGGSIDTRRINEATEFLLRAESKANTLSAVGALLSNTLTTLDRARTQVSDIRREVIEDIRMSVSLLSLARESDEASVSMEAQESRVALEPGTGEDGYDATV